MSVLGKQLSFDTVYVHRGCGFAAEERAKLAEGARRVETECEYSLERILSMWPERLCGSHALYFRLRLGPLGPNT